MGRYLNAAVVLSWSAILCLNLQKAQVQGVDFDYFASRNDLLCQGCSHGKGTDYYWCYTREGWDYCSPSPNRDYYGKQCKADHPCGYHGKSYCWCYTVDGSWGYCGLVRPKVVSYITSKKRTLCQDECGRAGDTSYFWCNTLDGWDYCSPLSGMTYRNALCNANHPCGLYGKDYYWCYSGYYSWDYCGIVRDNDCRVISAGLQLAVNQPIELPLDLPNELAADQPNELAVNPPNELPLDLPNELAADPPNELSVISPNELPLDLPNELAVDPPNELVCEKIDRGNKVTTRFHAQPTTDLADGGSYYDEAAYQVIRRWNNGFLRNQPTSNIIHTDHLRLDLQGFTTSGGIRNYNYQIQINGPRRPGQPSSITQVLFPVEECLPERYIRRAFMESLVRRARITVTVSGSSRTQGEYGSHVKCRMHEALSHEEINPEISNAQGIYEVHSKKIHLNEPHSNEPKPNNIYSKGIYSNEIHFSGIHSNEIHSNEPHSKEPKPNNIFYKGIHSNEIHVSGIHSNEIHSNEPHSKEPKPNNIFYKGIHSNEIHVSGIHSNEPHSNEPKPNKI
ncbi:uncharacterized protein [Ambystoma mexicanum]|uniref:uncharacterized protein n=1 Tax=Ambystoma mexicanum TaxID=8296 RepID=UPI0037E75D30